jgi:uncharacterized protein
MPAINLSSSYSQEFDTLISTGSTTWVNDNTLVGWYTARSGTGTTIAADTGSSNAGNLYSYGSSGSSDRALGSIGSGNAAAGNFFWGVRLVNNTSSVINTLNISYTGEQWRNSAAAAQTVDFQYLIGATSLNAGTWIDFNPLDFTSPITGGSAGALDGNAAANRVAISNALTGLTLNPGEEIWLRWSDIDHTGSDHGLAIDNFSVSAANVPPSPGFTVLQSGGNTTVNEQGETTDTYTIALNTTPTAPVTVNLSADAQITISTDGVNFFSTRSITLSNTTPVTITVRAVDDTVQESATHTGIITHSVSTTDPAYASLTIPNLNVSVLDNDVALSFTKIHNIQGSGSTFALGGVQTIEAIVVGDFQRTATANNLSGFYVQEEDADADTNPLTSEGLFVFDNQFGVDVKVGDKVRVTGTVGEFTSGTSSLTQLTSISNVTIVSSNNMLPTATVLSFPIANAAALEAVEGMRVTIPQPLVVTEMFELGRFGQVVLSSDGGTNQSGTDGRLEQYTQFNLPSVSGYAAYQAAIANRRIVLDDAQTIQNPDPITLGRGGNPLSASNTLRGGDSVTGLTGIVDDRFGASDIGNYRIQYTAPVNFQPTSPRETTAPNVGGSLKVASFNVLNYFNGDGLGGGFPTARGAENATEFTRQRAKIISAIVGLNADVVGLIEMENDGFGAQSAIQDLVNGLNAIAGAGTYAFINPGVGMGSDAIKVAMIYKPGSVTPVGAAAVTPSGFGNGSFDSVGRKPLAQTFQQISTGERFTAVINHWKSKGSSSGGAGDEDSGDGQGLSNGTRTRQAQDLVAWLATNPTGSTDPDIIILGDLNAYARENPVTTLEAGGYRNLLPTSSYSYVFDGQWGALDHALGSASLVAQVTGADQWHINSDEPTALDYNTNFKSAGQQTSLYDTSAFRSSDHDPIIIGLNLRSTPNPINGSNGVADTLTGTSGNDQINGFSGRDTINGGAGDDIIIGGLDTDILTGGTGNDQFVYNSIQEGRDTITDFTVGQDKIVLTQIFQGLGLSFGSAIASGYLSFADSSAGALVRVDLDGNAGTTYRAITLAALTGVTAASLNNANNFVV